MFQSPAELGIHEISKEQYLAICEKQDLRMLYVIVTDGGNPAKPTEEDVLMVSMSTPDGDDPVVSYVKLRQQYVFTKGPPWHITPLKSTHGDI